MTEGPPDPIPHCQAELITYVAVHRRPVSHFTGGDEIAAFTAALDSLPDLAGVLITADALHTQRAHADCLLARGARYLMTVRRNQSRRRPRRTVPGAVQAIKVVRRRRLQHGGRPVGRASVEVVYALTSLDHRAAHPGLLAGWVQDTGRSRTGSTGSGM